jgi:hypothetical protein
MTNDKYTYLMITKNSTCLQVNTSNYIIMNKHQLCTVYSLYIQVYIYVYITYVYSNECKRDSCLLTGMYTHIRIIHNVIVCYNISPG